MIRSHHRALAGLDRDLGGTLRVVWYADYSTSSLKADRSVCSYMAACPILYAVVCVFNTFNIINPKHMSEGTQVGVGGHWNQVALKVRESSISK